MPPFTTLFFAVLLPSFLLLASIIAGLEAFKILKKGEVWDSFYKHTYTREQHPAYFWFHVAGRCFMVLGFAFLSVCMFANFNPVSGLTFRSTRTQPQVSSALSLGGDFPSLFIARLAAGPVNFFR